MAQNHYETLGVGASASSSDLRAAYLKLARAHHPDQFDGASRVAAEARMQEINEAWNVVGVAHKRREYDRTMPPEEVRAQPQAPRRGRSHFKAFDDDPVNRADIDLDATPISGSTAIPRWVNLAPIGLVVGGVVMLGLGTLLNASGIMAMAAMSVLLGLAGFVLMPLIVMSRAERDPDL